MATGFLQVMRRVPTLVVVAVLLLAACGDSSDSSEAAVTIEAPVQRDADVIDLPFADNPDPDKCGIPTLWGGGQAWLTGMWEGELLLPDVQLYDSHQRIHLNGTAPHGAEVEVVLYQQNPVLDFYMVDVVGSPGTTGWVPAPFLSFEPVE